MWLAREILDYTDLVDRVHQPVVNHFYQLKPGADIKTLSDEKGMVLLDPRAHFKTTLAIASAVQWLINYPNIRLFFGAGKLDRASDSLVAVKNHFQHNPKLRALFPEFCPPSAKDWGTTTEFTLPNRTKVLVDPSCMAFSMDSIKAGPHCDVMFIDDAVHQDNIGNIEQLTNVIDRFVFMRSIVEPYGYIHVIGTPYSDSDLYAWLEEEDNGGWMRKFRRSAWAITNSHYMPGTLLTADDVQLLFPERFTFEFLNSIRKQNEFIFNCQYLLDPTPVDTATFTEQLIIAHTIPHAHIPKLGTVFQTWDLAFSEKQRADFTCGVTGLYDTKGNLFILDLVVGRFSPHALVQHIAAFAIKWRPRKVAIENAGGSKLLAPALDNLQRTLQRSFNIEWVPPTPFKSKAERILGLQPLLAQHKLYFSAAIDPTMFAELKKQFKKFPRNLHDDIPDAISMLLPYAAKVDIISEDDERNEPELLSCMWDSMQDNLLGAGLTG